MNDILFSRRIRRFAPALLLGLSCAILPAAARAAMDGHEAGLRLLQAQLPNGVLVRRAACPRLVRADHAATLAHRKDAVPILAAALSIGDWDEKRHQEMRFSCACVVRLFLASASAAPDESARLLETAEALYPECADDLTRALRQWDGKDGGWEAKDGVRQATNDPGNSGLMNFDPAQSNSGTGNSGDPGDPGDPGSGFGGGFGNGLGPGPGFPGSPGFGGSTASGANALPTPIPPAVTSVVNN